MFIWIGRCTVLKPYFRLLECWQCKASDADELERASEAEGWVDV